MKLRMLLILIVALVWCPLLRADDVPKALKQKVESRYKGHKVVIVVPQIIVGTFSESGLLDFEYNVHYDHFYQSLQLPEKYQNRNNLDSRTTEEVTGEAQAIDQLATGESLQVLAINFKQSHDVYIIDLMLRALAGKRLATSTSVSAAGNVYVDKIPFGVHFRFLYPIEMAASANYEAIVKEIDHYLLPEGEYHEAISASAKAAEASRHVELQPGMSKTEVLKALGEPQKSVVFGKKAILKYAEMTVEFDEDKLVAVKTD